MEWGYRYLYKLESAQCQHLRYKKVMSLRLWYTYGDRISYLCNSVESYIYCEVPFMLEEFASSKRHQYRIITCSGKFSLVHIYV